MTCACEYEYSMLNIGSIRIYILMTGVVSNETNEDVRMYIEEFTVCFMSEANSGMTLHSLVFSSDSFSCNYNSINSHLSIGS